MVDDVFVELVFVDEVSVFVSVELSLVVSVVLLVVELVELDWLDGKLLLVLLVLDFTAVLAWLKEALAAGIVLLDTCSKFLESFKVS